MCLSACFLLVYVLYHRIINMRRCVFASYAYQFFPSIQRFTYYILNLFLHLLSLQRYIGLPFSHPRRITSFFFLLLLHRCHCMDCISFGIHAHASYAQFWKMSVINSSVMARRLFDVAVVMRSVSYILLTSMIPAMIISSAQY